MKRLTAKNNDNGVVLLGSPSPIELAERLHQFEQAFDEDTIYQLESLRQHCASMIDAQEPESVWSEDVRVLDLLLALTKEGKNVYRSRNKEPM